MPAETDSLLERMKKLPLWQWGSLFIFGGLFANMAMVLMIQAGDMRRAEERAARLGAAIGGGLLIVLGIVLIVAYLIRKKPKVRKKPKS